MTSLPDLSTWHPVPVGATVHKGARVAEQFPNGTVIITTCPYDFTHHAGSNPRYTETPIRVPFPTDEGAQIIAGVDTPDTLWRLTRDGADWWLPHAPSLGSGSPINPDRITRWAPAPSEWHQR